MGSFRGWGGGMALVIVLGFACAAEAQTWTAPRGSDKVENGVNWTNQFIQASAIGQAPPYAVSAQHGRALAIEAGALLAKRDLLGLVRGVAIDSQTTVQAAMVVDSLTEGRVAGVIRGAQIVSTRDLGGGAVEVTVAVPATGEFAALMIPKAAGPAPRPSGPVAVAPPAPVPGAPRPGTAIYTGLVIDARGLGVKPAMAPKILSEGGQEIYGFSVVDRNWVIQQGMAGYSKDLQAAQAHERVTDRPLTIKAMTVSGTNKTDIVIANADAQLLLGSGSHLAFLEKARVMLVVD